MSREKFMKTLKICLVLISIALSILAMYIFGEITDIADMSFFTNEQNEIYKYLWIALFLPVFPIIILLVDMSGFFPKIRNTSIAKALVVVELLFALIIIIICIGLNLSSKSFVENNKHLIPKETSSIYTSLEDLDRIFE